MKRICRIAILLGLFLAIMMSWFFVWAEAGVDFPGTSEVLSDSDGWRLTQNEGGVANLAIINGTLSVNISNPGARPWSVLLEHGGLCIEKDLIYEVSFEARSQGIGRIQIDTKMGNKPYYSYSGRHFFPLNHEFHQYSFKFTMRQTTDRTANLVISIGRLGKGSVDIANVQVICAGPQKEELIASDFPKPFADRMMRGIIFGNTLDAPQEGAWAPELREEYFSLIKETAFFDHIRIPVRWNTHALKKEPYTIDPEYMHRVEWAVSQALKQGFYVVLNIHHYDELIANPPAYKKQFIALWCQISEHFRDYPENLYFEIFNEPHGALDSYWNTYYPGIYDKIRAIDPTRKIIISCPEWAGITSLDRLVLPKRIQNDPNIMVQFHFYHPVEFCFQGSIGSGFEDIRGHRWTGSQMQKKTLTRLADRAVEWSERNGGVKLWNGEFCAQEAFSPEEDRLKWTAFIIKLCEERDIAWTYWDFAGDSAKIYDIDTGCWNNPLLKEMKNACRETKY